MNTMNIEGKVPIAADAAALVIAYLDELNTKLNKANVKNSYLIVADVESMIIEALKRLGKTTKLGNDEVFKVINEEFDDPDEFVKIYLVDMNPEIHEDKIDRFMFDSNERRLIQRPKAKKKRDNKTRDESSKYSNYIRFLTASIPVFLLMIAITYNLTTSYRFYYVGMAESFVFTILSVVIFTIFEFITGLNGKLIVSIRQSIRIRYSYRGFFAANIFLTWSQYFRLYYDYVRYDFYDYLYWDNFKYLRNAEYYFISFQIMLTTYFILFVVLELMIFMRDHVPKFYPLEPEFRHIVRFLTPPYLLVMSGLFLFFILPSYNERVAWGASLVAAGILWANIRNYKVSPRFYIFTILFVFIIGVIMEDDVFYVAAYVVPGYLGFIIIRSLRKFKTGTKRGSGLIGKIKNKYLEYYNQ